MSQSCWPDFHRPLRRQGCRRIGAVIHFRGTWSYQDKLRTGAYTSEWMVDHPGEPPLLFEVPLATGKAPQPPMYGWAKRHQLDGAVMWPLREAFALAQAAEREGERIRIGMIAKVDRPAYNHFPGVELPRPALVREVLRQLYNNLIHHRRGVPEYPHLHRIRGRWSGAGS